MKSASKSKKCVLATALLSAMAINNVGAMFIPLIAALTAAHKTRGVDGVDVANATNESIIVHVDKSRLKGCSTEKIAPGEIGKIDCDGFGSLTKVSFYRVNSEGNKVETPFHVRELKDKKSCSFIVYGFERSESLPEEAKGRPVVMEECR